MSSADSIECETQSLEEVIIIIISAEKNIFLFKSSH